MSVRAPALAALPLAAACAAPIDGVGVHEIERRPPMITSAELHCDPDAGRWVLTIETDAWASAAITHWTTDAVYVERHRANSVSAAPDGSRDELLLDLGIVPDWRAATPNISTAFACTSDPDVVAYALDLDNVPTDCRAWGPHPGVWAVVPGTVPCPYLGD